MAMPAQTCPGRHAPSHSPHRPLAAGATDPHSPALTKEQFLLQMHWRCLGDTAGILGTLNPTHRPIGHWPS